MNLDNFLKNINERAHVSINHGRNASILHYASTASISKEQAEAFYHAVHAALSNSNPYLTIKFNTEYIPNILSNDFSVFSSHYNGKKKQVESMIGCNGLNPIYANCQNVKSANHGEPILVLSEVKNAVCFNGDFTSVTNPERGDYEIEVDKLIYPIENRLDCKTSSILMGISKKDASMGSETLLEKIVAQEYDAGNCPVLMLSPPLVSDVNEIYCASEREASEIRKSFSSSDFIIPIYVSEIPESTLYHVGSPMHGEQDVKINRDIINNEYMRKGSKVALKPMPEQPRMIGEVIASDINGVKIQWDNDTVGMYTLIDALTKIMPAPETNAVLFVEQYPPEIDRDSCNVLLAHGINPSFLYSMLSHFKPMERTDNNWEENIITGLNKFGVDGKIASGFVPAGNSFRNKKWIESELDSNDRLVIDMNNGTINVFAGEVDDYIIQNEFDSIEIE